MGRCAEDYREFAASLVNDWHVHALDFRGHGGSDRAPGQYLVTDYVRDTVAFLRREYFPKHSLRVEPRNLVVPPLPSLSPAPSGGEGGRRPEEGEAHQAVVIYGHSLGAMVALAVAATLPGLVRGIVLEDPPFHTMGRHIAQTPWQALFIGMRDLAQRSAGVEQLAVALAELSLPVPGRSGLTKLGQLRGADSLHLSARCLAQLDPEVFTPVVEGRWLDGYDEGELCAQVCCPVLLLQGDPSAGGALTDADADSLEAALPESRRIRFPGVGHLIHQDQPEAARRALREFAATLSSTTKSHEKTSSLSAVPGV